ncbi:MAG: DUF3703 domain-containing protein [Bdellovibrionaceae bacterium]|nr:DUF3703 domain-containing protein [Pseudobdellovibrionaceae bacterium]
MRNYVRLLHSQRVIERAQEQIALGHISPAWKLLEEAHIFSQPYGLEHTKVHWLMLQLSLREKNYAEAWGQFLRLLVAFPGSMTGSYPLGNTGRSGVSMFKPMQIPKGVADKIEKLNKMEAERISNGGKIEKYRPQHPRGKF